MLAWLLESVHTRYFYARNPIAFVARTSNGPRRTRLIVSSNNSLTPPMPFNDPELICDSHGVLEVLTNAKQQGKVRFIGFDGHNHPAIHLEVLNRGFAFDTVQMPLNPLDPNFRSFESGVLSAIC